VSLRRFVKPRCIHNYRAFRLRSLYLFCEIDVCRFITILTLGCFGAFACQPKVTRIHDGSTLPDRPINTEAYASYLKGRLLEHDGNVRAATLEYVAALKADPKAAEVHVRLGAMHCEGLSEVSERAFGRAESIDPNNVSLWQERANCALKTGRFELARQFAARALHLNPNAPRSCHLLIVANIQDRPLKESSLDSSIPPEIRANRRREALTLAWSCVSQHPKDSYGWHLLSMLYSGSVRESLLAEAAKQTRQWDVPNHPPNLSNRNPTLYEPTGETRKTNWDIARANLSLTQALYRGNSIEASKAARILRLNTLQFAIRAYELGAFELAYTEANRAFHVAPDNADAWALTFVLSEILGKSETFSELFATGVPTTKPREPVVIKALETLASRQSIPFSPQ
jgi:tetratricopeptide (TPR) repeat protein